MPTLSTLCVTGKLELKTNFNGSRNGTNSESELVDEKKLSGRSPNLHSMMSRD